MELDQAGTGANGCKKHLLAFLCREVRGAVEAEVLELGKE